MTITMSPGLYYMKGGSFTVGGGVTLKGTGVTIYMDNSGGSLNIQGGANVTLTPPTSGTYSGLTYFQDRSNSQALNIANGSTNVLSGTIYAAAASAAFAGGSSNKYGSQLILKSLNVSNAASIKLSTTTDAKLGYIATNTSGAGGNNVVMVE